MRDVPRTVLLAVIAAVVLLAGSLVLVGATNHGNHGTPPSRHDNHATAGANTPSAGVCELCQKPLVAEREVTLRSAGDAREHHYRCIHCALVAANDWFKPDVTLRTRSLVRGKPVEWSRQHGTWRVTPASAQVLVLPHGEDDCLQDHLVFADPSEWNEYRRGHSAVAGNAPQPAAQVAAILRAGKEPLPQQATCPVSRKTFHPTAQTEWTVYQGETYYFCCATCKPKFESQPAAYLSGRAPRPQMQMKGGGCGGHDESGGGCGGHQGGGGCGGHQNQGGGKGNGHSPPQAGRAVEKPHTQRT